MCAVKMQFASYIKPIAAISLAISSIIISSCTQNSNRIQQDFHDLEKGVHGYIGNIDKINDPISVSYGSIDFAALDVNIYGEARENGRVTGSSQQEARAIMSVAARNNARFWSMDITRINDLSSDDVPLMRATYHTDKFGNLIGDVNLAFPGLKRKGASIPEKNTEKYREMASGIKRNINSYNRAKIRTGDTLFEKSFFSSIGVDVPPGVDDIVLSAIVQGYVSCDDKTCILATQSEDQTIRSEGEIIRLKAEGYHLIEKNAGLPMEGKVAISLITTNQDKRIDVSLEYNTDVRS